MGKAEVSFSTHAFLYATLFFKLSSGRHFFSHYFLRCPRRRVDATPFEKFTSQEKLNRNNRKLEMLNKHYDSSGGTFTQSPDLEFFPLHTSPYQTSISISDTPSISYIEGSNHPRPE